MEMKKNVLALMGLLLATAVLVPSVMAQGHPTVSAKGYAVMKTDQGWVRGCATLTLFTSYHGSEYTSVKLEVCGQEFWWKITKFDVKGCFACAVAVDPHPGDCEEVPTIKILVYHRSPFKVTAYGRGFYFKGCA